ncbi:MAG TPA: RluA family pseudouridine synthase [Bacteroidota bacterium]|nr:RluA family pseudouridine synthase [Bacteroidota bacterium]
MKRKLDWRLKSHGCEILFEDSAVLALNKPAGLLVLPDRYDKQKPSLFGILNEELGKIYVVHRIDKETSGVIIFGKTSAAHRALNNQFQSRSVEKVYHAIVIGEVKQESMIIDVPLRESSKTGVVKIDLRRGKEAITELTVVKRFNGYMLLEVQPKTGRMHQIRVHLQHVGLPILGDDVYGGGSGFYLSQVKPGYRETGDEKPLLSRVALHASLLRMEHPDSGEPLSIEAPLPKDMRSVLKYLEKFRSVSDHTMFSEAPLR